MSEATLIKIDNLTFKRGKRAIFEDLSLEIPTGKVTAILGPSGTGKTTLLKLIVASLIPEQGSVHYRDQNMHTLKRNDLFDLRREIGLLFQSGALFTDLSVFENVAFPLRRHRDDLTSHALKTIVQEKLAAVGLTGTEDLMPAECSGGMARRVALARAIAADPSLMLYDEPFAGQDPILMGVLVRLIRELNDRLNMTSVVVTHDVDEVFTIADYVHILAGGRVIASGTPDEIRTLVASDKNDDNARMVKQFIRGDADGPVPFHYSEEAGVNI